MQWDNDLIWTFGASRFKRLSGFSVGLQRDLPILGASTSGTAFHRQRLMKHFKLRGIFFFFPAQPHNLANVMFYSETLNKPGCVSTSVWVGKVRERKKENKCQERRCQRR